MSIQIDYTDLHCHVLPGIDDGARDIEMTMKMVEQSYHQGVRRMIATPHFYTGHNNASVERVQQTFLEVKEAIQKQYPDFELYLGNEIYYKKESVDLVKEQQIHTMADTSYVLLEFNTAIQYKEILGAVRSFTNAGYYPILAHVERYDNLRKRFDRMEELINMGAYMQVNAENFQPGLFKPERKYCTKLIQEGLVHFIATDCHNLEDRAPNLIEAIRYLEKKVDQDVLEEILTNPLKLLENKYI